MGGTRHWNAFRANMVRLIEQSQSPLSREPTMAQLIYSAVTSLDGYVADATGNFDWAAPDDEVHAFMNDLERPTGTYLYGRKMYEVMSAWEDMPLDGQPAVARDFAEIWRAADKIAYSRSLATVSTARTRLEGALDPELVTPAQDPRRARPFDRWSGPRRRGHPCRAGG
jgi:hypothetical protein